MESVQKKTLVAKLAEACNAVGGVSKNGRNEFQKYNYVKAADIAKAIRHELFKRGVVIIPDEKEFKKSGRIKTNSGGEMREFCLTVIYTIHDSESADTISVTAYGVAMDSGDKAIYKCKTGATKYFLRAIGLIPDEKDDPEFDEAVDEQTDPRVLNPGNKAASKKSKKIAEYQIRAWDAACHQSGKTAEQVAQLLRVRYSAASVTELTQEDFKEAIKWAVAEEALDKTLASSVQIAQGKKQPVADIIDQMPDEFDQRIAGD